MKKVILLLFILFVGIKANASHVMGSEMHYKALGNGKYEVTLKVYRDCNGIALVQSNIVARCSSNTVTASNQTKVSVRDVTGVGSNCPNQSRCNGNFQYGIEEHIWKTTIDLSSYSCCEWILSWEQCCRNEAITTGQSTQNYYVTAELNKCVNNSSPSFSSLPIRILCKGLNTTYNLGLVDTIDANDSFSFELVKARMSSTAFCTYNGSYSEERPLRFLGFPNQNTAFPGGFHLDPSTGDLRFRPTMAGEVAVIVIEVSEWRKVNGSMQVIGKTRRDMQVIVIDCPSSVTQPVIGSPISYEVCAGDSLSIPFTSLDTNGTDSTFIQAIVTMPGANFVHNNGQTLNATGILHWKTDSSMIRNKPYTFVVRVWDNGCPFSVEYIRTVNIFVRDSMHTASFYAGPDRNITTEDSILVIGLDSLNIGQSAYWKSLGDGYFSDSSAALSTYYFGPNDRYTCEVKLLRIPLTQTSCGSMAPDTMVVRRWFGEVNADYDKQQTNTDTAYLMGTSSIDTSFISWWTSLGDGVLSDSLDMRATYTFGSQDSLNCGAWIYLLSNSPNCSVNRDSQFVQLIPSDSFQLVYSLSNQFGDTIHLSVNSDHSSPLSWSGTGNGTWFIDSANRTAKYVPDFGEKAAGSTTITVIGTGLCGNDSDSRIISFLPTGLNQDTRLRSFNAFPNPVKNSLSLEWEKDVSFVESRIIDVYGKVLIRRLVENGASSLMIDMHEFSPGIYFIEMIESSGNHSLIKLVKE